LVALGFLIPALAICFGFCPLNHRLVMAAQQAEDAERLRRLKTFHQQAIPVVGFVGAGAFAAMVLVLGNPDFILNSAVLAKTPNGFGNISPEGYLQLLAGYLAFVAGLASITIVMSLRALGRFRSIRGRILMYRMVSDSMAVSTGLFLGGLYLILAPVSIVAAIESTVFLVGALSIEFVWLRHARGLP
jgi:hypothetical protein